jgi:hypothetical protein
MLGVVVKYSDISEERTASIFKVTDLVWVDAKLHQNYPKEFSHPEDDGSTFIRNVGTFNCYTVQKTERRLSHQQQAP